VVERENVRVILARFGSPETAARPRAFDLDQYLTVFECPAVADVVVGSGSNLRVLDKTIIEVTC
jgi:hypothetical protein